jgi:hypothetical protein
MIWDIWADDSRLDDDRSGGTMDSAKWISVYRQSAPVLSIKRERPCGVDLEKELHLQRSPDA